MAATRRGRQPQVAGCQHERGKLGLGLAVLVGVALAVAALATVGLSWAVRRLRGKSSWRQQTASQQPSAPQADGHLPPRSWRPGDDGGP